MNSSIFDGDDEEGICVLSSPKNKTCKLGMKAKDNFKSSYCVVIEGIGCMCEWKVNYSIAMIMCAASMAMTTL